MALLHTEDQIMDAIFAGLSKYSLHNQSDISLCEEVNCIREELKKCRAVELVYANNIANAHPSDEFKCSHCGLRLVGYNEYDYDEEWDDETYYEFTDWNCCPRCGALIVDE